MAENILELVGQLEALLHDDLPAAVRDETSLINGGPTRETWAEGVDNLRGIIQGIDALQRQIGMATFEMVRRGEAPIGVIEPRRGKGGSLLQDLWENPPGAPAEPPLDPNRFKPPIEAPARCIGCMRVSVGTCGECKKPCCEAHLHTSQHPCGEMP